jgi:hypothetical protein
MRKSQTARTPEQERVYRTWLAMNKTQCRELRAMQKVNEAHAEFHAAIEAHDAARAAFVEATACAGVRASDQEMNQ